MNSSAASLARVQASGHCVDLTVYKRCVFCLSTGQWVRRRLRHCFWTLPIRPTLYTRASRCVPAWESGYCLNVKTAPADFTTQHALSVHHALPVGCQPHPAVVAHFGSPCAVPRPPPSGNFSPPHSAPLRGANGDDPHIAGKLRASRGSSTSTSSTFRSTWKNTAAAQVYFFST